MFEYYFYFTTNAMSLPDGKNYKHGVFGRQAVLIVYGNNG